MMGKDDGGRMKALTVWPEWLWAMRYLDKGIENRMWRPPKDLIGKRIALHAGKYFGGADCRDVREAMLDVMPMAVRAGWTVQRPGGQYHFSKEFEESGLRNVKTTAEQISKNIIPGAIVGTANLIDDRFVRWSSNQWGTFERYHWHLANFRWLKSPIPARGMPGLWNFDEGLLPPDTIAGAIESFERGDLSKSRLGPNQ
jgi:hypothetical protein